MSTLELLFKEYVKLTWIDEINWQSWKDRANEPASQAIQEEKISLDQFAPANFGDSLIRDVVNKFHQVLRLIARSILCELIYKTPNKFWIADSIRSCSDKRLLSLNFTIDINDQSHN